MDVAAITDFFPTLPERALALGTNIGIAILIFVAFWAASVVAARILKGIAGRAGAGREDVLVLIAQITRAALLILGALTAIGTAGVNVSALVAGLGLTGFALGFAFRDALSNVLAGAMILFYRPFRRGDHITVAGSEGTVREINLRYTIVDNATARVLIPNASLLTNAITVRNTGIPAVQFVPAVASTRVSESSRDDEETSGATPPRE